MPSACDQASAPVTAGGSGYGWHPADTACSLDCFSAHHDGTALLAGSKAGPSSNLGSVQTGLLSRADVDTTAPTQQVSSTAYQQHIDGTEQGGRCRQASSSKLGSVQTSLSSPVQLSASPHRHNMHRQQSISSTLAVPRCSDAAAKPLPRNQAQHRHAFVARADLNHHRTDTACIARCLSSAH